MEFHLAAFSSLGVFLHVLLVLDVGTRLTCVCSSCGDGTTVVHFEESDLCQEFLVLQSQCIHLLAMMDLLFIEEPFALRISDCVRANGTGSSIGRVRLDVGGDA